MYQSLILLALATICSAFVLQPLPFDIVNDTYNDERIIGGNEVRRNSYPFMVRIEATKTNGQSLCGASLLSKNFVVTAGHCVYDSENPVLGITVIFGDHNIWTTEATETEMRIPMQNIRLHAAYNEDTINNDIALIRLPKAAPISQYVQPICVASATTVSSYTQGKAIGWGLTSNNGQISEVLKEVFLPILPDRECRLFGTFNQQIQICAGNTRGIQMAICSGDSGGPFFVNPAKPALTGISSYGSGYGCVTVGYGVVFVRVSAFIPWLTQSMGSELCVT